MKKILLLLATCMSLGCATTKLNTPPWFGGKGSHKLGITKVKKAQSTPSFCFDGLLRKMEQAGCHELEYYQKKAERGFIRYSCVSWEGKPPTTSDLYHHDFYLILWLRGQGHYAMLAPEWSTHVCGDNFALLVAAEKD